MLVQDAAAGEEGRAGALQFRVGDTDIPRVVQGSRGVGVLLGFDDLVEDAVDVGGGDVGGVASVVAEGVDEGAVVVLLGDGGVAARGGESRAEKLSEDGAVVVWTDADFVAEFRSG